MIEIQIKTKHFRESLGYESLVECPLALACKDHFPDGIRIQVGGYSVNVGLKRYEIGSNWADKISPFEINKMINSAKEGNEVPTVTVTLTRL
jgi:hypothetical protein